MIPNNGHRWPVTSAASEYAGMFVAPPVPREPVDVFPVRRDPADHRVWVAIRMDLLRGIRLVGVFDDEDTAISAAAHDPTIHLYPALMNETEGQPETAGVTASAGRVYGTAAHGLITDAPCSVCREVRPLADLGRDQTCTECLADLAAGAPIRWCRATAYRHSPGRTAEPFPCRRRLGAAGRQHSGLHRTSDGAEFGADGEQLPWPSAG